MKAPKEYRNWIKTLMKRFKGKIPAFAYDNYTMERLLQKSKRNYSRKSRTKEN